MKIKPIKEIRESLVEPIKHPSLVRSCVDTYEKNMYITPLRSTPFLMLEETLLYVNQDLT
jgi:hypothetical protein